MGVFNSSDVVFIIDTLKANPNAPTGEIYKICVTKFGSDRFNSSTLRNKINAEKAKIKSGGFAVPNPRVGGANNNAQTNVVTVAANNAAATTNVQANANSEDDGDTDAVEETSTSTTTTSYSQTLNNNNINNNNNNNKRLREENFCDELLNGSTSSASGLSESGRINLESYRNDRPDTLSVHSGRSTWAEYVDTLDPLVYYAPSNRVDSNGDISTLSEVFICFPRQIGVVLDGVQFDNKAKRRLSVPVPLYEVLHFVN
ncbi:hypothetical protein SAMD00019534_108540 [Acytostelium subglobosum LB1]|uniref:hypothetical protein n=1 Tax=Acytostelium subglobosum LB1 TaxID=1410327 RepID=UPI000644A44F|nr:hypothetical protein SAMD00019534_108540 [Acytostelium subglobosum LB1]GAM27678.1 hypothetical protein SAMD00019534_108540 [Acytostelium subglobosum LB1]|eukprot:XP_012749337.1 hypothetical protein SAMD00019534_108540 [Acytostelium subglobosum LB1]